MQEKTNSTSVHSAPLNREKLFQNFFDISPTMMGIADVEGENIRHIADNQAAARFFGKKPEEISGKLSSELGVTPETHKLWLQHYLESMKTMRPSSFEYESPQNQKLFFSVTVNYMGLNENGYPRFAYIVHDRTEAKENYEKLRLSEERFRSMAENMSEGLILFDAEANLTFQNRAALFIHGYEPGQDGTLLKEEVAATWEAWDEHGRKIGYDEWPVARVFRHERFRDQVLYVRRLETGHEFYGSYNGSPVYDFNGNLILGFITIRDITEEIKVRKLHQESEERFRQISNLLPVIFWTATPDGYVDWYNDWWRTYTGLSENTDWDDPQKSPVHPDDVYNIIKEWKSSLESGIPTNMEFRIRRHSDGEYRWHLSRGVPIRDDSGKILKWLGSNTDIHDQKQLVKKLETERELRERFVATLSHDLRTPLTAARINAQMISRKADDRNLIHRSSARIVENLNRADFMIRDLLDVSRIKAGEKISLPFAECNLNQIISDTLEDLSTVHGDRFIFRATTQIITSLSDEAFRRILENLCSNAIKYGAANRPVTISLNKHSQWIDICVHNEGPRISQIEIEKFFQPFHRAGNAESSGHKGWGLGLTLVKGLTEAMGGNVSAFPDDNGLSFRIRLPLNEKKS